MCNGFILLYPYFLCMIEMLIEYYFFHRFLEKKRPPAYYGLFAFIGVIITALCQTDRMFLFIVYVILFMLGGILSGRGNTGLAVLYGAITIEVMYLCYGIFNSFLFIFLSFIPKLHPQSIGYIFMGIGIAFSLTLSVLCYVIIEKHFTNDETDRGRYAWMILAPALLIFLASEYTCRKIHSNTVTIDFNEGLRIHSDNFQILFMQCFCLVSLFCILYAYKKTAEGFWLSRQMSLLEQEAHSLDQYAKEAKTRFEKTKSFRHDVKNHMMVIKELLQNNQTEAALQYMGDMESLIADMSFPVHTNNPVLDILLENKLGFAVSRQIGVACSFMVPYPCEIKDMDFCIVLSNALDNAISACEQMEQDMQKFIRVTGTMQGSLFTIEILNSYRGQKAVNRGTGIANIKAVAEKYEGAIDIQTAGNVFTLSVLLIIPQRSDNISQQTDEKQIRE